MKLTLDELRTKLYMSNDPKEREIGELLEYALSSSCGGWDCKSIEPEELDERYAKGYDDGFEAGHWEGYGEGFDDGINY